MKKLVSTSIVGVWRVKATGAPTPYHMFVFHADGTAEQSNPAAGNTQTSDTAAMGAWKLVNNDVHLRLEEFRQDLKTGQLTRGVLDCMLRPHGDALTGSCIFTVHEPESGKQLEGPFNATLKGKRVVPS